MHSFLRKSGLLFLLLLFFSAFAGFFHPVFSATTQASSEPILQTNSFRAIERELNGIKKYEDFCDYFKNSKKQNKEIVFLILTESIENVLSNECFSIEVFEKIAQDIKTKYSKESRQLAYPKMVKNIPMVIKKTEDLECVRQIIQDFSPDQQKIAYDHLIEKISILLYGSDNAFETFKKLMESIKKFPSEHQDSCYKDFSLLIKMFAQKMVAGDVEKNAALEKLVSLAKTFPLKFRKNARQGIIDFISEKILCYKNLPHFIKIFARKMVAGGVEKNAALEKLFSLVKMFHLNFRKNKPDDKVEDFTSEEILSYENFPHFIEIFAQKMVGEEVEDRASSEQFASLIKTFHSNFIENEPEDNMKYFTSKETLDSIKEKLEAAWMYEQIRLKVQKTLPIRSSLEAIKKSKWTANKTHFVDTATMYIEEIKKLREKQNIVFADLELNVEDLKNENSQKLNLARKAVELNYEDPEAPPVLIVYKDKQNLDEMIDFFCEKSNDSEWQSLLRYGIIATKENLDGKKVYARLWIKAEGQDTTDDEN